MVVTVRFCISNIGLLERTSCASSHRHRRKNDSFCQGGSAVSHSVSPLSVLISVEASKPLNKHRSARSSYSRNPSPLRWSSAFSAKQIPNSLFHRWRTSYSSTSHPAPSHRFPEGALELSLRRTVSSLMSCYPSPIHRTQRSQLYDRST